MLRNSLGSRGQSEAQIPQSELLEQLRRYGASYRQSYQGILWAKSLTGSLCRHLFHTYFG